LAVDTVLAFGIDANDTAFPRDRLTSVWTRSIGSDCPVW
jgi:hypothetical protein